MAMPTAVVTFADDVDEALAGEMVLAERWKQRVREALSDPECEGRVDVIRALLKLLQKFRHEFYPADF